MKTLIPLALTAALLCGCPNTKLPSTPPKAPEPKISTAPFCAHVGEAPSSCTHDESLA